MFNSKPERLKMMPILFPETFLRQEESDLFHSPEVLDGENAWLLKYFPKYYKLLNLRGFRISRAVRSKVEKLKVVRDCHGYYLFDDFKKLLRSSRKTLSRVPVRIFYEGNYQHFSSCLYFPKVKALDLTEDCGQEYSHRKEMHPTRPIPKKIYASYGHFWGGNRFVESLELALYDDFDLILLKKIGDSTRFLSCLKGVKLLIKASTNTLIELLKNKNLLKHITHFTITRYTQHEIDWRLIQSLIDCCPQLYSLSLPTVRRCCQGGPDLNFCLDLSSFQNLQALKITVDHIRIFLNGIDFPPSLREMTLDIVDSEKLNDFSDIFEIQQDNQGDGTIEDQDAKEWMSFVKHDILSNFFEKCKKLSKLQVLNLKFNICYQMDVFKHFLLPLLRTVPQLETFNFTSDHTPSEEQLFDLEFFFSEIQFLHSLKHLGIISRYRNQWIFSGAEDHQKLRSVSNLSSFEISGVKASSSFNLKKFLSAFLDSNNTNRVARKSLKFDKLNIFSSQDLIKILNLMRSVAHFPNLQIELQIYLTVENIDDLFSNFPYPIYVASNTRLKVEFFLKHFQGEKLTNEQKQDLKMRFGQFHFTLCAASDNKYVSNHKFLLESNNKLFDDSD